MSLRWMTAATLCISLTGMGAMAQEVIVTPPPEPAPNTTIVESPSAPQSSTSVTYQPRTGLIVGGLVTFGLSYGASVVAGAVKNDTCDSKYGTDTSSYICRTQTWPLNVPLAGPFIQMGYVEGRGQNTIRALLAIDGVVQAGGLVMALVGIGASSQPAAVTEHSASIQKFYVSPFALADAKGIGAGGQF